MEADSGNRSLHPGISIPQWMKNKITDTRLDFDEAAFSPPENDDSFLYIRYPQEIARKLKSPVLHKKPPNIIVAQVNGENIDFNHTEPCRQYILKPEYQPIISNTSDFKIKSNGVDDGFKGDGAACGSSVIRVAHQMVAGKYANPPPPKATNEESALKPPLNELLLKRRGSRSLPASPLSTPPSSPKTKRRLAHKYFTGAFVENEGQTGSWLLQGLLGKRESSQSISNLPEENLDVQSDLVKAASELHLQKTNESKPKKEFKAKPSEFREMNFWSPTSM